MTDLPFDRVSNQVLLQIKGKSMRKELFCFKSISVVCRKHTVRAHVHNIVNCWKGVWPSAAFKVFDFLLLFHRERESSPRAILKFQSRVQTCRQVSAKKRPYVIFLITLLKLWSCQRHSCRIMHTLARNKLVQGNTMCQNCHSLNKMPSIAALWHLWQPFLQTGYD